MDKMKKMMSLRNVAGFVVLAVTAVFGQVIGSDVNNLVNAVSGHSVEMIMMAVGGLLIEVSHLFHKKDTPPAPPAA